MKFLISDPEGRGINPLLLIRRRTRKRIKTMNHNRLLLKRFFDVFGVNPNTAKNKIFVKELIFYGTIAA
jgi:hypothetical protein